MIDLALNLAVFSLIVLAINVMLYTLIPIQNNVQLKIFRYFLFFALGMQIMGKYLQSQSINNLPGLHFYTILEFIFLSFFYRKIFYNDKNAKEIITISLVLGGGLVVINSIFLQSIYTFNSNAKTLTQLIIMGYAIAYYFLQLNNRIETNRILNILNAAILIYYAGSFFIFMFSNVLLSNLDQDTQAIFWFFNAILYLGFQVLVLFAGWQHFFKTTKSSR